MIIESNNMEKFSDRRSYRTRIKAGETDCHFDGVLAVPTLQNYQYSISLNQSGNAYLRPLKSTSNLQFKNGMLFFDGIKKPLTEVELQNLETKEGIDDIDIPLLQLFYSIILTAFENSGYKELKQIITLYVPDLAEYLGFNHCTNYRDVESITSRILKFHNIAGILHTKRGNSIYPVLNFEGYDDDRNTVSFSSPYMNHVIMTVYEEAIRTRKGKPVLKSNGEPLRIASHSYLVYSDIVKEKCKVAVENVILIVTLIEQAGNRTARIKARTLIDRNPQFKNRLENSSNPAQLLKRVFTKTWELLRTKTKLLEVYKNITLPDPADPDSIPSLSNLNKVFEFPHNGKIKR